MLKLNDILATISQRLDCPPPSPDATGVHLFPLAGDMTLKIQAIPGSDACLAWSDLLPSPSGTAAAEAMATQLLNIRLARLRQTPDIVASRDQDGVFFLYTRLAVNNATECLGRVARLLDEVEAVRRLVQAQVSVGDRALGGLGGLFSTAGIHAQS
ncbi:MAG: hypothetical protein LBU79_02160 [Planctomycetota bacterium]|jgi:hypothetical protein|nr:hypothetical protein [Planctomycetota bacterium]